jgi:short subunit dehydrogenase-like uncharacterized protein
MLGRIHWWGLSRMESREFDVVVWGASGFTGALVAEYLLGRYGVGRSLRWALAGRSADKLERVRSDLAAVDDQAADLPIVIADSKDVASLASMVARTQVVCTTVGPYALYGSELVAACVAARTHYCDLTGEVHWMRQMIDTHHDAARSNGTRIVHTCGFDSIPSDMGVYWLQREMRSRHGVACRAIKYRAESFKGGFSGGTIASMLNMLDQAEHDSAIRTIISDPYGLNPASGPRGLDSPEKTLPEYDLDFQAWVTPFVMAVINTKVVRRSNALLDFAYGRDFRYDEGTLIPYGQFGFPIAAALAGGSSLFTAAAAVRPLRNLMTRMLPAPGQGPDARARENGYFDILLLGKHPADGAKNLRLRVKGDRDPGYGSTCKMLGESAVCLALDGLSSAGGVLTPSVAMGDALLSRLQDNAGVSFTPA